MKKILLPLVVSLFVMAISIQDVNAQNNTSTFDPKISVYPNPTKDFVIVNNVVELGIKEIEVFDILSKKVKITFTSGLRNAIKLDLTRLDPGIYFVRFYDQLGKVKGTSKVQKTL